MIIPRQASVPLIDPTLLADQCFSDGLYKCPECEQTMKQKTYFILHVTKHSGQLLRPSKCPQCPYTSKLQSTLDLHVQSLHYEGGDQKADSRAYDDVSPVT